MSEQNKQKCQSNPSSDYRSSSYTDYSPSQSSFSTYDIFQQRKPSDSSNHQQSSYSNDTQYKSINSQNLKKGNVEKEQTLQSVYEEREKRNRYYEGSIYGTNQTAQQGQNTKNTSIKHLQQLPYKKLEDFTIRQVLQLPLARQEYLKGLSDEQLSKQAEFKYIFTQPDTVFEIGHFYQKQIMDEELRRQIILIQDRQDLSKTVLVLSLFGYVLGMDFLEKHSPFKGQMRTKYHLIFPFTMMMGSVLFERKITKKKQKILQDQRAIRQFRNVIRTYLCQTSQKQRRKILKKEIQKTKKNQQ